MSLELEDIREKKRSVGLYVVIGLLLVGMAGFGTSQFGTGVGAGSSAAFKLGDSEISTHEFNQALNDNRQRYPDMAPAEVEDLTVSQLRSDIALTDYLKTYPMAASNKAIDDAIRNNVGFHENGEFSEDVFRRNIRVEPATYRKAVSNNIAKQEFQRALALSSVVSKAELAPYVALQNLSRDILVAKIARDQFSHTASDEEIQAYFDAHKAQYMTDELVNVEYVELNPKAVADAITVSDEALLQASQPARDAKYYLFADEQTAKTALERHGKGEAMGAIVKSLGEKIDDSGELDQIVPLAGDDSLIPQNAVDALFALSAKGQLTQPISIDGSVYLFELTSEPKTELNEADKKVALERLQAEQAAPKIAELNEKLNAAFFEASNPDLTTIAEQTGLPVKQSGLSAINSQKDILAVAELVQAIENGDKTVEKLQEPVTVDGRVIIYRLTEHQAPEQKTLEQVKPAVEQAVVDKAIADQVSKAAEALTTAVKANGLEQSAKEKHYPTRAFKDFNGQVEENPVLDAVGALFIMQQPPKLGRENVQTVKSINGDTYVYVNSDIRLGEADKDDDNAKALQQRIAASLGQIELGSFVQSLSSTADIKMRSGILENNDAGQ